jgi:hypothetical protein
MGKRSVGAKAVRGFVKSAVGGDLHPKLVDALSSATLGVLHAANLAVATIGRALAQARDLNPKHAIKQVDRLLSNAGFKVWELFLLWVPYVVAERREIVVAMDWTEFDQDDHSTIALNLLTSHGRATPLVWLSVTKSQLEGYRNEAEDAVLRRLKESLPSGVAVTILADRGFGDTGLYALLSEELSFGFVIRFRSSIHVESSAGEVRTAAEWLFKSGAARLLRDVKVTHEKYELPGVVVVQAPRMKEPWCLAVSHPELGAAASVKQYGRRFTIEENFRDTKDLRFGMGLRAARIKDPDRRDRLLFISAMAVALLTLLGAAGESIGMDRMLKANTSKQRTHSLFTQGVYYYGALPNMRAERRNPLLAKFGELVAQVPFFQAVFSLV